MSSTSPARPPSDHPLAPPLPTGLPELDALLPGGLTRGAVTELMAPRGLGLSTALALHVVALAQQQPGAWAAFVDPAATLHGAGVATHGVDLGRLLVVRPPLEQLALATLRAAAAAPAVLVVDVGGVPGARLSDSLSPWVALVRRLATCAEAAGTVTLLLTHRDAGRTLPLPVTDRLELTQEQPGQLLLRRLRHRAGLPSEWQSCALPGWRAPVLAVRPVATSQPLDTWRAS